MCVCVSPCDVDLSKWSRAGWRHDVVPCASEWSHEINQWPRSMASVSSY